MKIQTVKIDGYKNLSNVKIALSNITALVALNNFGKSNFLSGIDFAITFIKANIQKKIAMMSNSNCIPMHRNLQGRNYRYEMDASTEFNNHKYQLKYEFEFCWKNSVETDPFIVCESLKIKTADAPKFTQIIDRNCECATYRRTESGRCSTIINVCPAELVVNKLAAFDDLYYSEIIKQLNNVKVYIENNLDAKVFYQPDPIIRNGFESEMISVNNLPRIIFDIKEKYPDKFELLRDVYMQLFPNIDDLIVRKIQIDAQEPGQSGDIPYVFSKFIHVLYVRDQNFSNPINFETMSDGAKRVFMILTKIIVSTINDVSLIAIEEPENSVHPGLFQSYIRIISQLLDDCSVLITSHSPYIVSYLEPEWIHVGMNRNPGIAEFFAFRGRAKKQLQSDAKRFDMSMGDYLFSLLSNSDDSLNDYLENNTNG
ncbi:MAG: AAA family ATPase [Succinivibrionaceae bacterium]|nr:AAA family ATPase [Succinivibrionaceae bacterium]